MSFNEKLQFLRKENKLSQEQLADMLDVTRQSVSKWESGTTYPEMDKLIMLCKIFKCSLDDLTNDEITEINVTKKERNSSGNFLTNILDIINKTVRMFRAMSLKQKLRCIFSMFILALVLLIFRIPFGLLEDGLESIIVPMVTSVRGQKIILGIFCFILDIIYYALYVLVYVYIYKVAYLDKYEFVDAKKRETLYENAVESDPEKIVEHHREVTIINNDGKENSLFKLLGGLALGFIKFLVICFSLPVVFMLAVLFFFIAISVYLMFDGIFFIGVLLGLVFLSLLVVWLLVLISMFVFNRKISFKKMLILFLTGVIGCGISSGIIALEVTSFNYKDEVPLEADIKHDHFEREMTDELYISNYYADVIYVSDDTRKNVVIDVEYYGKIYKISLEDDSDFIGFNMYYSGDFDRMKFMLNSFKKCLKEKVMYNFDMMNNYKVTITANSENIQKIKNNTRDYVKKQIELEKKETCDYYEVHITDYENEIERLKEENIELHEQVDELERFKEKVQNSLDE